MDPVLAMMMLADSCPIDPQILRTKFIELRPEAAHATVSQEGENTTLSIGEEFIIFAEMPAPIPWSDLEGPCATSLLWKNAAQEVKAHKRHVIIFARVDAEPIEAAAILTQAAAAGLAACPQAIGMYWGNATMVLPKALFIDAAVEMLPEGPPVPIWVDFRVGRDSEKTSSGFTTGMKALGHMEIETEGSPEPPAELYDRLMSLAGYLLSNGPVINDGDTVGADADEKIRVKYAKSSFGHQEKVMRLVYETESQAKPWWKLW